MDEPVDAVGFAQHEIDTASPTRATRLKWVLLVDRELPPGRAVNAAVCVASATVAAVPGLLGPDAIDASGSPHPGLPWAGCSVLAGSVAELAAIRSAASAADSVFVADMPAAAQHTRVYDEYLETVGATLADDLEFYAVSIVGPRNRVDRLVRKLSLLP